MCAKKTVDVKKSKVHTRKGTWVRSFWRRKTKPLSIKKYKRRPPQKNKKKNETPGKKKTVQTRFGKPKGPPKVKKK